MPRYIVHFDNGHSETVEAVDGTTAKSEARKKAGLAKDIHRAQGDPERVAKITRVEQAQQ